MPFDLLLLRHGKSDWKADAGDDRQRPLAARGRRASERVGRFLKESGLEPALALVSPARRTLETYEIAIRAAGLDLRPKLERRIYEASPGDLLAVLAESEAHSPCLLVGHEPGCSRLVEELTGARVRFPTAGLAWIHFDGAPAWDDRPSGELLLLRPGRNRLYRR